MNGQAKDAYHTYHVQLGTVQAAPAFEQLSPREQEAWTAVAHVTEFDRSRAENAQQEALYAERRAEGLSEELHCAKIRIEAMEDELKAFRKAAESAEPQEGPKK